MIIDRLPRRLSGQTEASALELPADHPRPAVPTFRAAVQRAAAEPEAAEGLRALARAAGSTLFLAGLSVFVALLRRLTGQEDLTISLPAAGVPALRIDLGDPAGDPPFRALAARLRDGWPAVSEIPLDQAFFQLADLSFALLASGGSELSAEIEHSLDLFEPVTVRRWIAHFWALAAGAAGDPGRRLSELPLLSAAQRHQLLVEWNDSDSAVPRGQTVPRLFAEQARRSPGTAAISEGPRGERSLTYGELARRADGLAWHLRSLGVGPEVLVALCVERSAEMVVGALGVLQAGGAYVPVDPSSPDERLGFLLRDTNAAVVLTQGSLASRLSGLALEGAPVLALDRPEIASLAAAGPPPGGAGPASTAYVIYTSGSTGRPKGVAVGHAALANLVRWCHDRSLAREAIRTTQVAAPGFDATVLEIWPSLTAGATLCIMDDETRGSTARLVDWLIREEVALSFLPTPLTDAALEEEWPEPGRLEGLTTGGDRLRARGGRPLPVPIWNFYGPTEATVLSTFHRIPASGGEGVPPIGRPVANAQVYLLDAQLQAVAPGAVGEIWIGGAGVARGYLGRPDLTAERFLPDPFAAPRGRSGARMYRTGDLGRFRMDGVLDFLGRTDHQIKVRGVRIELGEIEAALASHPGVREVAVVTVEEGGKPLRLAAFLVPAGSPPDASPGGGELRKFLAARLPEPMIPSAFILLDGLPLTANGKVDRRALARLAEGAAAAAPRPRHAAPRTAVEVALAGTWAELLAVERIGLHDDFLDLGGHSLLAARVLARVRHLFGVDLGIWELFEARTLEGLARTVEQAREAALGSPREAGPRLAPAGRGGPLPLSFAQQRLWFLYRLQEDLSIYNLPMSYRLLGRLDPAVLEASLGEVVRRHEALRTTFDERGGEPVQVIAPAGRHDLPLADLSGLPAEPARREAWRIAGGEPARPFDLTQGPLLRTALLRVAPEEHLFLLSMHHIVSDGWSMGVLLQEIGALAAGLGSGSLPALQPLPVQYADFAVWQRAWLHGELLESQLAWWREKLAGHPPLLELPADRPRPALQSFRGAVEPVAVDGELTGALRRLSRQSGATLFMTVLAAFETLLLRLTGQPDLLVGTPTAGRSRIELEGLIGFFVNTLVLRTDLSGDPGFTDLVGRVRETALGAFAHADLPLEQVVVELAPERSLSYSPLFQAVFVLHPPAAVLEIPGLRVEETTLPSETAKFDLTLALTESGPSLTGGLEYSLDLFDAATAHRFAGHLGNLLHGIAAHPGARLSELPLLSAAEERELVVTWNATYTDFPREGSIHRLFEEQARATPDAPAVIFGKERGEERLTYAELDEQAGHLARRLRAAGVEPGMLVALSAERSPAMVVGFLGILKAGAAYVPLDPSYPQERLAFLLADTDAPVLVTQRRLAGSLPAAPGVRTLLLDGEDLLPADGFPTAREAGGGDLAYVIYTSGSTGRPKGVAVPHRAVLRLVLSTDYIGLAPGDRVGQVANASFDAVTYEVWGALLNGGTVVILPQDAVLSPSALAAEIRRQRVDAMFLTAALFNQVAREAPGAFATMSTLLVGGEALDPVWVRSVLANGPPRRLLNGYGPTENTTFSTWHEIRELAAEALSVPIGRPISNTRAYVLDDSLRPVPVGVHGGLHVGGDGLALGYLHRPELTAERFVPDPFGAPGDRLYATGDLVRRLADGAIDFLGRRDEQVKIRGFRIELGEIETVLSGHPAVEAAAVLAPRTAGGERRLVAYLAAAPGAADGAPAAAELREHVRRHLPDYMVPSAWVWLETLPLTPNGKLDRKALAQIDPDASLSSTVGSEAWNSRDLKSRPH